jgi:hypothetical protein
VCKDRERERERRKKKSGGNEWQYFWGEESEVRKKGTIFPVVKVPRQCPLVLLVEAAHLIGMKVFMVELGMAHCDVLSSVEEKNTLHISD